MALTAWLIAPAPIAWTSTRPLLRITPAIAPATATGFEVAETLSTSTGTRSADIAGTPSNVFTADSLDRCSPALHVPAHGRLLRGRLGVHVAEHTLHVRVLGQDRVRGPEGVVEGVEEDAADQVHDEHLVPAGLDHAPALARRRRRVVGRPEHVLQAWQLADELLLGEDVVAAGDHVRAQAFQL